MELQKKILYSLLERIVCGGYLFFLTLNILNLFFDNFVFLQDYC
jgi:hypothetical protein